MFRKLLLFVAVASLIPPPANAQLFVFDPGNLVEATLIAYRMQQHYAELRAQFLTILRMGQGLGNLDRYRIATIPITAHDPGRWDFGRPWIQALNSGDATGEAYLSTALPLLRPTITPANLTAAARRTLERQYATIEIA